MTSKKLLTIFHSLVLIFIQSQNITILQCEKWNNIIHILNQYQNYCVSKTSNILFIFMTHIINFLVKIASIELFKFKIYHETIKSS